MSQSRTPARAEGGPGSNDCMAEFDRILEKAAEKVRSEWFELPVIGEDAVYRERVYCYELYHQMRCLWPNGSRCRLNGEVDKINHPYFKDCAPKPDFLVHVPGGARNYAVIEVKSCSGVKREPSKIKKDIEKLIRFTQCIESVYDRAIYLIFGREARCVAGKVQERLQEHGQAADKVEVWIHCSVGKQAVQVG